MNIDLINDVGSLTKSKTSHENEMLNDTNSELCSLFGLLSVQANNIASTGGETVIAFQDSIIFDPEVTKSDELNEIVSKWVNIEEDAEVKQDEIQEYIQMLESKNCGESEYSGGDEEVQNKDNNVVMNEPEEDIILWNEAIDAMDTIRSISNKKILVMRQKQNLIN